VRSLRRASIHLSITVAHTVRWSHVAGDGEAMSLLHGLMKRVVKVVDFQSEVVSLSERDARSM